MLRNLILSAAAAGLAAGLLTATLQHVTTTPIILQAERYENTVAPAHDHSGLAYEVTVATHGHEEGWAPAEGIERTLHTSLATVVLGVGFSLALLAVMVLSGRPIDGRAGLAFGAAGFAAIALAPALGLPPEMPGSSTADLGDRQTWWLFAVLATAGGLAALLLGRGVWLWTAGVLAIAVPHIVGAPRPEGFTSTAPAELAGHFVAASLVVTAVFWAVLGFASGAIYERLARSG
jgi:cobalt transporter subunit CbtA